MQHRQIDLSNQLSDTDLTELQKLFKEKGWEATTAEITQVARNNASSNHWKDIICDYLKDKETTQEKAGTPPAGKKKASAASSRKKSEQQL